MFTYSASLQYVRPRDISPLSIQQIVPTLGSLYREFAAALVGASHPCSLADLEDGVSGSAGPVAAHRPASATTVPFSLSFAGKEILKPPTGADTLDPRRARASSQNKPGAVPPSPPPSLTWHPRVTKLMMMMMMSDE